jgi:AraC-like DNA-binding protein
VGSLRLYRSIRIGVEKLTAHDLPRHYHREPYATVVLSGRFRENAFSGESAVQPGDVLLHGAFDAHCNAGAGCPNIEILRLPWDGLGPEGHFRIADPDRIAVLTQTDPREAVALLKQSLRAIPTAAKHWSVRLADALCTGCAPPLTQWAQENALSEETVSRGFRNHFGVTPRLFRLEARTRLAWRDVLQTRDPLTAIAHDRGFADLAHMSRSVLMMTGAAPSLWRRHQVRSSADPGPGLSQRDLN